MLDISKDQAARLRSLDYTNEGNALAFIELYGGAFHYNRQVGWLMWVGTHWQASGAEEKVKLALLNTFQARRLAAASQELSPAKYRRIIGDQKEVNGAMYMLRAMPEVHLEFDEFDNATGVINCLNGVVDLRTGKRTPHNQRQKFTYCIDLNYNPQANHSLWIDFMEGIGLDQSIIEYLQKAVGYSLTGETSEEVMFYVHGESRSGKGTFTEVIELVMGALSAGVSFKTLTAERTGDTNNFDLAPLKPKHLLIASESSRYRQLNAAMVKSLTGGDWIRCCFKNKDHFSYRPRFVIWVTSNWKINADVDDDAIWGRIKAIHFPKSFLGKEDKTLKSNLKSRTSLEGVLSWAVAGAVAWYASLPHGLKDPEKIKETGQEHRAELDSIGQFLDSCCIVEAGKMCEGRLLYNEYKEWCQEEGHKARIRKTFTQSLQQRGIESKQVKIAGVNKRRYVGVGLLSG